MWLEHWNLAVDPFFGPNRPYIPGASHDEAVARLVATVEAGQRLGVVRGAPGLGKSTVLTRALSEVRGPGRRVARSVRPADAVQLANDLTEGLGGRVVRGGGLHAAWRGLVEAVRVCQWQRVHPVLAVDDPSDLLGSPDRAHLERLLHLGSPQAGAPTVLQACRTALDPDQELPLRPWDLSIRLAPLTREESGRYVVAKLAAAGRPEPAFTPSALAALHLRSRGVPAGLDRVASLALMAAASDRLPLVTPDVIQAVAAACLPDVAELAA